jgi:hypothetical protein
VLRHAAAHLRLVASGHDPGLCTAKPKLSLTPGIPLCLSVNADGLIEGLLLHDEATASD